MRIYTVHHRPAPPGADPDVVLVKEGFCWPALLLPPVWLIWHRQWLGLVLYLAGALLAAALGELMNVVSEVILGLGYALLIGASANDWRRARLAARGYGLQGVIAASTLAEAERRYFHERAQHPPSLPTRPATAGPVSAYRRQQSAAPLAPWSP